MLRRFWLALGGVAVLACLQSTPALATTVGSYDDGTLRITATGLLDDTIGFSFAYGPGPGLPDTLTVYDIGGGVTSEYCAEVNTEQMDCSLGGISRIVIETGDGNDFIDFGGVAGGDAGPAQRRRRRGHPERIADPGVEDQRRPR